MFKTCQSLCTFYTENFSLTSSKKSNSIIDHTIIPRIFEISSDITVLFIKRGNCKKYEGLNQQILPLIHSNYTDNKRLKYLNQCKKQ